MTLVLTVHRATCVPKMDLFGHCDPYCTVRYSANENDPNVWKSAVALDGKSPTWELSVTITRRPDVDRFVISLYDEDTVSDEYIGCVSVPTSEPITDQPFKLKSDKTETCLVYVSLQVNQPLVEGSQYAPTAQQVCAPLNTYPMSYTPGTGTLGLWIAAFASCDGNKSGTVSQKELIKFFRNAEGGSESDYKQRTREFFKKADGNRSGTLEIPEFIRWMVEGTVTPDMIHEIGSLSPDLIRITLRSIDSNKNDVLTSTEIQRFFHGFGMKFKEGALKKDKFGFAEFVELLQRFDPSMVTLV